MSPSRSLLVCAALLVTHPTGAAADVPAAAPDRGTAPSGPRPTAQSGSGSGSGSAGPTDPQGTGVPEGGAPVPTVSERILAGITRVGPLVVTITREARDLALGNINVFARAARIVPANLGDGVVGYRLFGIRAQSVVGALGLRNGDLLRSVNGRPTTTVGEVLAAYGGLRGASAWTVVVHRGGADVTLTVRVVDDAASTNAGSSAAAPGTPPPAGAPPATGESGSTAPNEPAVSSRSTRGRPRARE